MLKNIVKKCFNFVWHDPVFSKVIATGFVGLIGVVLAIYYISWNNLLKHFGLVYYFLFSKTSTYNWVLVLLVLIFCLYVFKIFNLYINKEKIPAWSKVNTIQYLDINWRWENIGYERVKNIRPFCPACDLELHVHDDYMYGNKSTAAYYCLNCGKIVKEIEFSSDGLKEIVKKQIELLHRRSIK